MYGFNEGSLLPFTISDHLTFLLDSTRVIGLSMAGVSEGYENVLRSINTVSDSTSFSNPWMRQYLAHDDIFSNPSITITLDNEYWVTLLPGQYALTIVSNAVRLTW